MKDHDFKNFPELTNAALNEFYWDSPHKQITEDFRAKVVKVIDGDTIRVKWSERDFDFPVRFLYTAAPELSEDGGPEAQSWLEDQILGEEVDILIAWNNRVEKWGRLLGVVMHKGMSMNEMIVNHALGVEWENRGSNESFIDLDAILEGVKI